MRRSEDSEELWLWLWRVCNDDHETDPAMAIAELPRPCLPCEAEPEDEAAVPRNSSPWGFTVPLNCGNVWEPTWEHLGTRPSTDPFIRSHSSSPSSNRSHSSSQSSNRSHSSSQFSTSSHSSSQFSCCSQRGPGPREFVPWH